MALVTRDQMESYIWPRYKESATDLSQVCWDLAKPKKGLVPPNPPAWFDEIIIAQMKMLIMAVFGAPQKWMIIPEVVKGFSMVINKKTRLSQSVSASSSKINLRYHSFDQFSEFSKLVEKTLVHLIGLVMKDSGGDVIELENEDGNVFIFPISKMSEYLLALGFSQEQIPQLLTLDDVIGFYE